MYEVQQFHSAKISMGLHISKHGVPRADIQMTENFLPRFVTLGEQVAIPYSVVVLVFPRRSIPLIKHNLNGCIFSFATRIEY